MSRKPIVVVGAGRAGKNAVDRLSGLGFDRIRVVDPDPAAIDSLGSGVSTVVADGVQWLAGKGAIGELGEWIIPTVPLHLAFEWLLARFGSKAHRVPVDPPAVSALPGVTATMDAGFTASLAKGLCPTDCEERKGCSWTRSRGESLPEALERCARSWPLEIIRSRPLAPGLGGFPRAGLDRLLKRVESRQGRVMVATACRCHGVIHALELNQGGDNGIQV